LIAGRGEPNNTTEGRNKKTERSIINQEVSECDETLVSITGKEPAISDVIERGEEARGGFYIGKSFAEGNRCWGRRTK